MEQSVLTSRKQLSNFMFLGGILGLVFGGIHLSTFISTGSQTSFSDAGFNAGLGVLELLGGWLVRKSKLLALVIAIMVILASSVYSYLVGRGINFTSLALGGLFLTWMINVWRRGGLS